jgi:sugar (pentulose or hexulose) kinase
VGAALVAAVGLGIYPDFKSLKKVVKVDKVFEPKPENSGIYENLFRLYQEVYGDLKDFYRKLNKERFDKAVCD